MSYVERIADINHDKLCDCGFLYLYGNHACHMGSDDCMRVCHHSKTNYNFYFIFNLSRTHCHPTIIYNSDHWWVTYLTREIYSLFLRTEGAYCWTLVNTHSPIMRISLFLILWELDIQYVYSLSQLTSTTYPLRI